MDMTVEPIKGKVDLSVEIVVHITETLGESQRKQLVSFLESEDSIISAEFCPLRYHLMLVRYDKSVCNSQDILGKITENRYAAQLIGPI